MLHLRQTSHLAAMTVLLGALAVAPAFAVNPATETPADTQTTNTQQMAMPTSTTQSTGHVRKHETAEDRKEHVENRIATLHEKLKITPDQESDWNTVAQTMRDNEAQMADAYHERQQMQAGNESALDDLKAYQKITQTHADAMGKFISSFTPLYNSMSASQKANADAVFAQAGKHMHHHHHAKKSNG